MEFNPLDNLWIVLLGLFLISLPYLYYIIQSNGMESKTTHSFQEFTSEKNVVLNKVQKWRNHYILGLDTEKNMLIYYKYGQFPSEITVNLEEVDHASLDVHYEELKHKKERIKRPEYLNILLYFKDPKKAVKSISVYDKKEDAKLDDEVSIANYWVQTINGHLKSGQKIKLAV
ncbi:hypothetical protein [Algoriphagus litoralis]|uniref:hypothetical protein n=1 Tax=Algoriphagus litoralis TaxID=2202829 RepID=UPI000DB9C417|nr:hypothetical protein [Algoriphagus litoralis]